MSRNLYQQVTDQILAQLKAGHAPWVKPWSATAGRNMPHNISGRPYGGINVLLLWSAMQGNGWHLPRFLTFNQARQLGGNVRKGEHGTMVVFVKQTAYKSKDESGDDEIKHGAIMKAFTVFNIAQCENLPDKLTILGITPKARNKDMRDATIDEFITSTRATINHGGDRAFFATGPDYVQMPQFQDFKSAATYYGTLFHELGHWTGGRARLNREFGKRFGDKAYAAEELVAELTAAFVCAEFNLDGDLRHAGYIASWIDLLTGDPRAFFTAASKAQQAANYLRGLAMAEEQQIAA
jgi:antirestriction protein ArdC